ncbi:MAG: PLP-dependent aminotransferase family protein [Burkholderiales bacterium]|nr:PLP-dependent aminotransferase family protein [Phycisphaerae bacterium]
MSSVPPIAFSAKARRTAEQPISYLIAVAKANPQLISFAAGLVDPLTLPTEETLAIAQRILSDKDRARDALQYGTTVGYKPLRDAIVRHLEQLEGKPAAAMSISADNVVLTTGSQQALYILADILLDPGDIVIIESPSYFVYAGALSSFGARIIGVPMDRDGMAVEELDKLLHRLESHGELPRVKAIYCQSYFQNPTGLTLSLPRRPRLVEIARKYSRQHRILIIEDAAYRELLYDGEALPSIKSFDPTNSMVASCYTFDKPFAAGIKTGYAVLPPDVAREFTEQKGNHDFGSSHLCQQIAYEALADGSYSRHLTELHDAYRAKRDVMLAAMEKYMPAHPQVQWTTASGGLYVWLSLPLAVNTSRNGGMFDRALGEGVMYVPGEYCFQPDEHGHVPQNHMRLCYAVTPIEQIETGIERLASIVRRALVPAEPARAAQDSLTL